MITVTTAPAPPRREPKEGDAFTFTFGGPTGNTYTCLVIASNRVIILSRGTRNASGWSIGDVRCLSETWNAHEVIRGHIYTKVTIHLEA